MGAPDRAKGTKQRHPLLSWHPLFSCTGYYKIVRAVERAAQAS